MYRVDQNALLPPAANSSAAARCRIHDYHSGWYDMLELVPASSEDGAIGEEAILRLFEVGQAVTDELWCCRRGRAGVPILHIQLFRKIPEHLRELPMARLGREAEFPHVFRMFHPIHTSPAIMATVYARIEDEANRLPDYLLIRRQPCLLRGVQLFSPLVCH